MREIRGRLKKFSDLRTGVRNLTKALMDKRTRQLFEKESSTYTYLLADQVTREAVLIVELRRACAPLGPEGKRAEVLASEANLASSRAAKSQAHASKRPASPLRCIGLFVA